MTLILLIVDRVRINLLRSILIADNTQLVDASGRRVVPINASHVTAGLMLDISFDAARFRIPTRVGGGRRNKISEPM